MIAVPIRRCVAPAAIASAKSPDMPAEIHVASGTTARTAEAPDARFQRLPLRDCDFFVVAFDQMLRDTGQVGHIAHSLLELDRVPDAAALKALIAELPSRFPILNARLQRR